MPLVAVRAMWDQLPQLYRRHEVFLQVLLQQHQNSTTDDIMEKLANIMGQMSTKDDLINAVGPLTKSVTKLEEQFANSSTSFIAFEQKIKSDI